MVYIKRDCLVFWCLRLICRFVPCNDDRKENVIAIFYKVKLWRSCGIYHIIVSEVRRFREVSSCLRLLCFAHNDIEFTS